MKPKKTCMFIFLVLVGIGSINPINAQVASNVTGRIMDAGGEYLIGVSVLEKGTSNGTVSDLNGTYVLNLKSEAPVLRFSSIGYKDKEVVVGKEGIIDVVLEEALEALDELVVVGYGTQKKASVAGAITSIKPKELSQLPSRSVSNNLAGMVSGVIAVQRSGNPWENNSDFWIRGVSTFAGNSHPLVLVDGIERSLNDLDVEEIESFSVLKDAAASAVYGVRGANGVIMINTKRGKIGKPQIEMKYEKAFLSPTKIPEFIGSPKYLEVIDEMLLSEGSEMPMFGKELIEKYRTQVDPELYPDVDWWETVTKDYADNQKLNFSVNGGSDILRYSLVFGLFSENGILKRDPSKEWDSSLKVNRYTVRSNVDTDLTPTTLLRVNIGGFLQTKNSPPYNVDGESIFYECFRIPPYVHPPVYNNGYIPLVYAKQNPWAFSTQRGYAKWNHSKIESLISLKQDLKFITPGLSAKVAYSFDKFMANSVSRAKTPDYYNPATVRDENGDLVLVLSHHGEEFLGYETGAEWGNQSVYVEGSLSYNRTFDSVHEINSMLLYNQKNFDKGDRLPYRSQGLAGRVSYSYDRRYIAEFNFGYNGSENFSKGNRFGFFPAMALGWVVSEEEFMQDLAKPISNLKLRGSVGQAGNSDIGGRRFAYISTIADTDGYTWGSNLNEHHSGKTEGEIGVPDLTWETVTKFNVGVELGLWNNALNYTVDIFKERRKDIFMQRENVPASAGFNSNVWSNYGKVDNQGVDMSLRVNKQLNEKWFVSALANFTYAHNEVIEMDEPKAVIGTTRSKTGKSVDQFFGLIAEGLFTENDFGQDGKLKDGIPVQNFSAVDNLRPGDIKYRDLNGDNFITDLDRTAIGYSRMPEIVYGFGANVKYQNVDFGFFFQGVGKTSQILGGEAWLPGAVLGVGNMFTNIDDRWTEKNPHQDVFWPRMSRNTQENNVQESTWWLRDMSFLRLKSLELGYTLPSRLTQRVGIRDSRLFLRGGNLLTFSKFKLWDPELETQKGDKYPQMKSVSLGLNITFNN